MKRICMVERHKTMYSTKMIGMTDEVQSGVLRDVLLIPESSPKEGGIMRENMEMSDG